MNNEETVSSRPGLDISRTHQRFLLRQLHFTQQFAAMYFLRLGQLTPRAEERLRGEVAEGATRRRVLELAPGEASVCIGTIFKHVKKYPRFLDEYQKELVRIELGEDDGDGGEGDDAGDGGDGELGDDALGTQEAVGEGVDASAENFCSDADILMLEDDSGRVEITGVDVHSFVTGMIVVAVGVLLEKGKFDVVRMVPCGASPQRPLFLPQAGPLHKPIYVAFVCGLSVGCLGTAAAQTDLLVDFLNGNIGDEAMFAITSRISRLVIGGNSIDGCEELRLKDKVKLDPSDHVKVSDTSAVNTAANCMRALDRVLSAIADTVDVDLMPGETDPSNSFLPQQPLHPITLREASKRSSLRLVTNPYEFNVTPSDQRSNQDASSACVFVTSGSNVHDMMRQSRWTSPLDALATSVECGCACPTAPNSLLCYPFQDSDPFLFTNTPHVLVACNQREFSTSYRSIPGSSGAVNCRLVAVPSFSKTGAIVLVDVASSAFPTTQIQLL
ncbi:DNA polymerase delta subunit, putative [Bodo saltans]|uniref:DNA polymerase delta subunit, putative n=1 Tax=Bodo saltans TaxID=75058 RepID=A0A0S4IRV7_BODSA|nr:DNA polymerase delta subunit, putative [Bodo saltans]|eukprot:CUF13580.1 DNA polymerase delta subunit, putative [Bodo saltans]